MKKKGTSDIIKDNAVYLILTMVFFSAMLFYLYTQKNGAAVWGDIYAKEIVKMINLAEPGDDIYLNVQKITSIAMRNEVPLDKIFSFEGDKSRVCVRLSVSRKNCYNYFNNVKVDASLELGVPDNLLNIKVSRKNNAGGANDIG